MFERDLTYMQLVNGAHMFWKKRNKFVFLGRTVALGSIGERKANINGGAATISMARASHPGHIAREDVPACRVTA